MARRLLAIVCFWGAAAVCWCSGSIRLYSIPAISVADGQSTVTVYAELRASSGDPVPDGTVVRFSTTAGTFKEVDARANAGVARAVLVAPGTPGVSKVTASAPSIGTVNSFEVEFVSDRSILSASRQYAEVTSGENLFYSVELRLISAAAADRSATVKYREITIEAKDLQLDISQMKVVANDAVLIVDGVSTPCQFIRYNLTRRRGVAIADVNGKRGGYDIAGGAFSLSEKGVLPKEFEFADVGTSPSSIHAEKIVAFPQREVQFHDARMYVGDTKIMGLPLYALNPNTQNGIFENQIIGFANGGLQLDYPYYLKLSPSQTSLFRVRSGQSFARGGNASRGVFLDWENKYMLGENGEGSLTLAGIGRSDMGLSWFHTQRFDERTTLTSSVNVPGFKSVYGSVNASRSFEGFNLTFTADSSQSLRGNTYRSQRADLALETVLKRVGDLPVMTSFGLTANSSEATFGKTHSKREGYGLRGQFLLLPQKLWGGSSMTASLKLTQLWGNGQGTGFGILGNTTVTTQLGQDASLSLSYDYVNDAFTSALTGHHRLGGEFFMEKRPFSANLFGGKSLDIDSFNLFADGSYHFSKLWRVGTQLSYDEYRGSVINDQSLVLGYRLGTREIGLTYSVTGKRFGFQLLNAPLR